ncbi:hypothetical protein AB0D02_25285 [Streptomyces pseudogriseolus]
MGTLPEPYWITYELLTGDAYVTRRLTVTAEDASGSRSLDLRHDGRAAGPPTGGGWTPWTAPSTAIWACAR